MATDTPTVESGPYTPAPWSPDFAKTAGDIYAPEIAKGQQRMAETSELEQQAIARRGTAVKEAVSTYREQRKELPPPPPLTQIGPPPSRQLTDFLAPVENQPPERTVMQMISALTMLGTGIGGLAKGDARAALSSLTGALTGWKEGQRERADRAFKDWQAQTDALLINAQQRHQQYIDIMENAKLSNEERLREVHLSALEYGDDVMAAAAAKGDAKDAIGVVMANRTHMDNVATRRQQLEQSFQFQNAHLEIQRAQVLETIRRDMDTTLQKEKDRAERSREFEAKLGEAHSQHEFNNILREALVGNQLDKPARNRYWDPGSGEVRQASQREVNESLKTRQPGTPGLTELNAQQVNTVERLAAAGPVLNALDKLIDRINAEAPGENITQGLINRLKRKAGIGEDIARFMALRLDAALENAAAISQGTPRIGILYMLKGEASPTEFQTAPVAHAVVDMARTTIGNRMGATTGDQQSFKKITKNLDQYQLFSGAAQTQLIKGPDGTTRSMTLQPGETLPPGYTKVTP